MRDTTALPPPVLNRRNRHTESRSNVALRFAGIHRSQHSFPDPCSTSHCYASFDAPRAQLKTSMAGRLHTGARRRARSVP